MSCVKDGSRPVPLTCWAAEGLLHKFWRSGGSRAGSFGGVGAGQLKSRLHHEVRVVRRGLSGILVHRPRHPARAMPLRFTASMHCQPQCFSSCLWQETPC